MPALFSAGTISVSARRLRTRIALVPSALRTTSTIVFDSAARSGTWCQVAASPASAACLGVAREYGTAPEAGSASEGKIVGKEALYQSTRPACERKLVVSVR